MLELDICIELGSNSSFLDVLSRAPTIDIVADRYFNSRRTRFYARARAIRRNSWRRGIHKEEKLEATRMFFMNEIIARPCWQQCDPPINESLAEHTVVKVY